LAESTASPPRPWLAAILSLIAGPVAQIYAGSLGRAILIWCAGIMLLVAQYISNVYFSIGIVGLVLMTLIYLLIFRLFILLDAFFLVKRNRDVPRKAYQTWWFYILAWFCFSSASYAVAFAIRSVALEAFAVESRVMAPTLHGGDHIIVDKFWYGQETMQRGDIIVFKSKDPGGTNFVMRVIGLPGDKVEIRDNKLVLNGEPQAEPYAFVDSDAPPYPENANLPKVKVPEDSFYVLGDDRRRARDSRLFGSIPMSHLRGQAKVIYWSRKRNYLDPSPMNPGGHEIGPIDWDRIGKRLD
jgi:signal peptidase I